VYSKPVPHSLKEEGKKYKIEPMVSCFFTQKGGRKEEAVMDRSIGCGQGEKREKKKEGANLRHAYSILS